MQNALESRSPSGLYAGKTLEEWREFYEENYFQRSPEDFYKMANSFANTVRPHTYYRSLQSKIRSRLGEYATRYIVTRAIYYRSLDRPLDIEHISDLYVVYPTDCLVFALKKITGEDYSEELISDYAHYRGKRKQVYLVSKQEADIAHTKALQAALKRVRAIQISAKEQREMAFASRKKYNKDPLEGYLLMKDLAKFTGANRSTLNRCVSICEIREGDVQHFLGKVYYSEKLATEIKRVYEAFGYLDPYLIYKPDLIPLHIIFENNPGLEKTAAKEDFVLAKHRRYMQQCVLERLKKVLSKNESTVTKKKRSRMDQNSSRG